MMPSIAESYRLSPQQERIWRSRLEGGAFAAQAWVEIDGELDGERLGRSLARVTGRHEILRSRFVRQPGRRSGAQVIEPAAHVHDREVDASTLAGDELAARLADLAEEEAGAAGGEGSAPGPRLLRIRPGPGRSFLLLTLPALAGDAVSLCELLREVLAVYGGEGRDDQSGEPFQYADYAAWHHALSGEEEPDEEMVEARRFWAERAGLLPECPRLPFVRPAVPPAAFCARSVEGAVAPELAALVAGLAGEARLPVEVLALAAFDLLLRRRFGLEDLVLSTLAHGRLDDELRQALGPFGRWLPVHRRSTTGEGFLDVARDLALALFEARRHQEGFSLPAGATGGETPAAFAWTELPPALAAGGATARIRRLDVHGERFAVKLEVSAGEAEMGLALAFDTARVDPGDAQRLLCAYRVLLEAAVTRPQAAVEELPVISPAERRQLLDDLSCVAPGPSPIEPVHRLFERHARERAGETAVVSQGRRLSYGELEARANLLAHRLREAGVGPDRLVGLLLERSVEMVVALLATLKAGGAYVPLEPAQPAKRLEMMIAELVPAALVTQASLAARLPGDLPFPVVIVDEDGVGREDAPRVEVDPGNLAYLVFTSGSTGVPKGVLVEHRHVSRYTASVVERLDLTAAGSFAMVSTFAADLGNTCLFAALATGGTLHVLTPEQAGDGHAFGEYCALHGIDCLKIVPSHLDALLAVPRPGRSLPRKRLVLGGEACRPELITRVQGLAHPGFRVFNHYGPSETTVGVLTHALEGVPDPRARTVPIGRPLAGSRVYVLDRRMDPVAPWAPGEVYIGGDTVTRGYLKRPDLTADRFVPDPHGGLPGARLYRTGDIGRFLGSGGEVEFLGRVDHQVKYHGFRVELGEIRNALARHPDVRDAVVVAARAGDRDVLIAYYVARQELEVKLLRAFLAETILEETIPGYFVHLRRLPLNLNGKIHYAALPSFEEVRQRAQRHFVEPRNAEEVVLAEVWAEVLELEKVSIDDNFFEIGGHSLLATRVVSRLRQRFSVEIPLRALFEVPTIAGLAAGIREGRFPRITDGGGEDEIQAAEAGDLARQLAELDGLSDEEARELIER